MKSASTEHSGRVPISSPDTFTQEFLRSVAERLPLFGGVDAVQPDANRGLVCRQNIDGIPVKYVDHFASDLVRRSRGFCDALRRRLRL